MGNPALENDLEVLLVLLIFFLLLHRNYPIFPREK